MKKLILLGLATLITFSASAQIEMYTEKPVSQASKPTAIEVKNKLFPVEHSHVFISDLSLKVPNLIGDTLFSVPERIDGENEDAFNCVLTLNATKDTIRIKQLPVGEYFYVRDIIPTSLVNYLLLNDFANKVFVSDTFYHHSYKKGQYIIPKTFTVTYSCAEYRKTPCWIYLCGNIRDIITKGHISEEDCINNALSQDGCSEALYVLENNGTTYYVRSGGRYESTRRWFPVWGNYDPVKRIYYANLSSFISVKSYNMFKEKYVGEEVYMCNKWANKRHQFKEELKLHQVEKILVKDGMLYGEFRSLATDVVRLSLLDQFYELSLSANGYINEVHDTICCIGGFCLKSDADSLLAKWAYEEEQIALAKKQQQTQHKEELIKKYGKQYGSLIADGKICVGMTKEMCIAAKGSPCRKSTHTDRYDTTEVWTYHCNSSFYYPIYVTFTNNKITSIADL